MRRPVYDRVVVLAGFEVAHRRFRGSPDTWLPEPATPDQGGFVVRMRATGLLELAGVEAVVEAGSVEWGLPGLAMRTVAWRARTADRLFPRLVGDLELSASTATACRLTLVGSYQPPISVVGEAADRVAGRHVADAVIRGFLEQVAGALADPVPAPVAPRTLR